MISMRTLTLIPLLLLGGCFPAVFARTSAKWIKSSALELDNSGRRLMDVYEYDGKGNEGLGCFPGDARIRYTNDRVGLMRELRVGEQVAALDTEGHLIYSTVYAFGHEDAHATAKFVRLSLAGDSRRTLELSPGHFIPTGKTGTNKRASDVHVGDLVWAMNANNTAASPAIVEGVSVAKNVGLFNPLTLSGTIIVNSAVASVHSEWFLDSMFDAIGRPDLLPATYQAVLAPARLLYKVLGREGYVGLYNALDSMFSAAGGIAGVGNYFGGAIAATGAAGLSAGLVLAAVRTGGKTKAL